MRATILAFVISFLAIDDVGELPHGGGLPAEKQFEHINWSRSDLPDVRQARRVQAHGGFPLNRLSAACLTDAKKASASR